jgi:hypothetical protein
MNTIKKVKNSFVIIREDKVQMATLNIATGRCVGATAFFNELMEHYENYKKTDLNYVKTKKSEMEKRLNEATKEFHFCMNEFERLEALEKELEAKCNTDKNKSV